MNKIDFTAKDNFPLSSQTMEMLQQMISLSAKMALLGGEKYILSGCAEDGNNVSAGIIIINGEILPFESGTKKAKVTIQQTSKTLNAFGVEYPEAYIYRTAKFSDTGEYDWSDFNQIKTNTELMNSFGDAPGTVKMWAGVINRIPDNYRLCNGDTLNVLEYPELAYSLGVENMNTFRLPDLRKRFVVGYDNSAPDYNSIGKTGGEEKVELQIEHMPAHSHQYIAPNTKPGVIEASSSYIVSDTVSIKNTEITGDGVAHENRPPYFVLAYIIKVR